MNSRLGSCPKCKGYLMLEKDTHGLYEECLQCGYSHDLQTVAAVNMEQDKSKQEIDNIVSYQFFPAIKSRRR